VSLLKNENGVFPFVNWLVNTLIVSVLSTIISTLIIIMMSYVLSRLKFAFRKPFLQIALVLGMFPGFMSMIALYYILKSFNMLSIGGLVMVYAGVLVSLSTSLKVSLIPFRHQLMRPLKLMVPTNGRSLPTSPYRFQNQLLSTLP
jgi:arabinogalactan oligomer/maltooligosaccharide transport system permease protein